MNTPHAKHLKELEDFFRDANICRDSGALLVEMALCLAASGHAGKVLKIVERSPEAALFETLANGLRLHLAKPLDSQGDYNEPARQIANQVSEGAAV